MKSKALICALCLAGFVLAWTLSFAGSGKSSVIIVSPKPQGLGDLRSLESGKGEIVKGCPYSATLVKEIITVLGDGNRIVKRTTVFVARDSQGRTLEADGESGGLNAAKWRIINDPFAHVSYLLMGDGTTSGKSTAIQYKSSSGKSALLTAGGVRAPTTETVGKLKRESLGTRIMQGLLAQGTRETSTIPAGMLGNERQIDITSEVWYSPDLHVVVLRKKDAPRTAETVWSLSNIKRAEPDAALFRIPAEDQKKFDELAAHTLQQPE